MKKISLQDKEILKTIFSFSKNRKVKLYIVGGFLRDLFLEREKNNPDLDFCLKKGAINFARALSREIRGGFVVLDKEHGAARIVKRIKNKTYTMDFTDFRGKDLEEDLYLRDFTINTLALSLDDLFSSDGLNAIIDLYQGKSDLKAKIIRAVNEQTFDDDPLRILRCFSFSCIFGFKIEKATLKLVKQKKDKLSGVSFERIRDELFKILGQDDSIEYLLLLDKYKILSIIIPEIEVMRKVNQGPYHHLDVLNHSFEAVRQLEKILKERKHDKDCVNYLNEVISSERRRIALVKLATLLHDIGKPKAKRRLKGRTLFHGHEGIGARISLEIAKRLKLSNDEINALRKMVFWHLRPGYLADNEEVSKRAKFRYFRDTAREGVSTLLLSLADQRATRGPLTSLASREQHERIVTGLIKEYFKKEKEIKPSRLLTGDDLIKKFKLKPSPLFGKILSSIEELQAIGRIKNQKEAFREVKKIIKKSKGVIHA